MTTPFTYTITHIPSGVHYYGVRYRKGCAPDDLGTTYFSSSRLLLNLISEEGIQSFKFKVRRIFGSKEEAISWERKFLIRVNAAGSAKWFNRHNGSGYASKGGHKLNDVTKNRMRKPKSAKHRAKLIEHLDKHRVIPLWSEERKLTHSENMKGNTFGSTVRKTTGWSEERRAAHVERMKGNTLSSTKPKQTLVCPHCGKIGKQPNMTRYHFSNCRANSFM